MFNIQSNLNRRSNRYNIYQPQRYALYVIGKWMGLIGSAMLLLSLTIKWYFFLNDNSNSFPNIMVWCMIVGSVLFFAMGTFFILGLHWFVEKKYNHSVQVNSDEVEKTQKQLRQEHRNQSKRYKKERSLSWLKKWRNSSSDFRINRSVIDDNQSSSTPSIKPNSTTIYNTNPTESSFQIISNDSYISDTTSTNTSTSFSSTKKLVRTNSKFNQPNLPVINESKQQNANDNFTNENYTTTNSVSTNQDNENIFDAQNSQELTNKPNKTKHVHKTSTGSAKNYILEAFLKQDLGEGTTKLSDQMMSGNSNNQIVVGSYDNSSTITTSTVLNKPINQAGNQSSNQNSISSQNNATNANVNDALDLTE